MTFNLIYPAMFVFLMMSIGVVLTISEFYRNKKIEQQEDPRN